MSNESTPESNEGLYTNVCYFQIVEGKVLQPFFETHEQVRVLFEKWFFHRYKYIGKRDFSGIPKDVKTLVLFSHYDNVGLLPRFPGLVATYPRYKYEHTDRWIISFEIARGIRIGRQDTLGLAIIAEIIDGVYRLRQEEYRYYDRVNGLEAGVTEDYTLPPFDTVAEKLSVEAFLEAALDLQKRFVNGWIPKTRLREPLNHPKVVKYNWENL